MITSGLNHTAHSGMLGEGLAVSLMSGRLRHWWKPDANVATVGISIEAGITFSIETGQIELHHGVDKGIHPYSELSIGAGIKAGGSITINSEGLYFFGPKNLMNIDNFYGGRTNIISSAGLGGYHSAYGTLGNGSTTGRVAGFGFQLGLGVGGGAGINYGWSGSSFNHIKRIINE